MVEKLRYLFLENQSQNETNKMSDYMRNKFSFYGVRSPIRKLLYKDIIKEAKTQKTIDWNLLDQCYQEDKREFHYFVWDYLNELHMCLTFEDITKLKNYLLNNQWWDTIDSAYSVIGSIGLRDKRVTDLMIKWSTDKNLWIRRISICHQLKYKQKTNINLLKTTIINNLGTDEFFINKAIGWSLREYSKTNPEWVRNMILKYQSKMNSLSIREASKYL